MPSMSYGEILRDEREKNGIDLTEMSRKLHIRPDILASIEDSDFDRMPARGYTKNMIRAYARSLGLNERQITDLYLEEIHMHELGHPGLPKRGGASHTGSLRRHSAQDTYLGHKSTRGNIRASAQRRSYSSRFEEDEYITTKTPHNNRAMRGASTKKSSVAGEYLPPKKKSMKAGSQARSLSASREKRSLNENSRQNVNSRQGASRNMQQTGSPFSVAAIFGGIGSLFSSGGNDNKVPRSVNSIGSMSPYAQQQSQPGRFSLEHINLPLALSLIAAFIVVMIVVVVVTNSAQHSNEDVPSIPISGLTDTSNPTSMASNQTQSVTLPTSVVFEYSVKSDNKVWIEVYLDDKDEPEIAAKQEGPQTQTFEVTSTLLFKAANANAVVCKLDGKEVTLEQNSKGEYTYKVDFAQYLTQWEIDHGLKSSASSSASSSTKSSSSKSSSSKESTSKSSASKSSSSKSSTSKKSSSSKSSSKSSSNKTGA